MAGCRAVVHLAGRVDLAPDAPGLFPLHVGGTRHVVEAAQAAGVERIVLVSTSGAVGMSEDAGHIAGHDAPFAIGLARRWPYYHSKLLAEKLALESGAPVVVISPALLLGPGVSHPLVTRFAERQVPFTPRGTSAIVDVRDAADAVAAALSAGELGARYLLGHNLPFAELFARLHAITGAPAPLRAVPSRLARVLGPLSRGLSMLGAVEARRRVDELALCELHWGVDDSRARDALGYAPRPIDETLAATVDGAHETAPSRATAARTASATAR